MLRLPSIISRMRSLTMKLRGAQKQTAHRLKRFRLDRVAGHSPVFTSTLKVSCGLELTHLSEPQCCDF